MSELRHIPVSLKAVAWLFILGGISSLIEVIVSLNYGTVNFNFGVLGIFIGLGLFKLRPGWRTWALIFVWIGLVSFPLGALAFLVLPGPIQFTVFGQRAGNVPTIIGVLICAIGFAIVFWQYRVLTRPDVRSLFSRSVSALRQPTSTE